LIFSVLSVKEIAKKLSLEEKMKFKKAAIVVLSITMIALISVACGGSQATTPAQSQAPATTQETGSTVVQPTAVPTKPKPTAPDDVPIMPDAYAIEIPNQETISYKVDTTIQDVVDFYEANLPGNGWDQVNNPDSVVGAMAQMSRSKANGDRITFSIQYNPVGEFTIVQIYITRIK
jgi:hypothetical protein